MYKLFIVHVLVSINAQCQTVQLQVSALKMGSSGEQLGKQSDGSKKKGRICKHHFLQTSTDEP